MPKSRHAKRKYFTRNKIRKENMASVTATPQASTLPATVEITHDKFTSKTDISDPTKTHNNRERNNAISEPKRIGIITTIVFLIEILLAVFLRRA